MNFEPIIMEIVTHSSSVMCFFFLTAVPLGLHFMSVLVTERGQRGHLFINS